MVEGEPRCAQSEPFGCSLCARHLSVPELEEVFEHCSGLGVTTHQCLVRMTFLVARREEARIALGFPAGTVKAWQSFLDRYGRWSEARYEVRRARQEQAGAAFRLVSSVKPAPSLAMWEGF